MRFSTAVSGALALAGSAFAAPVESAIESRAANIDLTVLQFALTLEHLENVFYKTALKMLSLADFEAAGYSADYYNNLHYVAFDEQTHVLTLEGAIRSLGAKPVKACTYDFGFTDVPSFILVSQDLENVGVSAYTGAAPLITSKYYLSVAATILDVEAIHTSYQRAALGEVPMANPFETPLSPMAVFTLASQIIVKCPSSNAALPFTPFPYLTANGAPATCEEPDCSSPSVFIKRQSSYGAAPPSAGDTVSFTAAGKIPAGSYLTFLNGIAVASVKATIKGKVASAAIPSTILGGQAYAFITSKDLTGDFSDYTDSAVLFGPAAFEVNPGPPKINYNIL